MITLYENDKIVWIFFSKFPFEADTWRAFWCKESIIIILNSFIKLVLTKARFACVRMEMITARGLNLFKFFYHSIRLQNDD